ncbi:TetR/AcrR family transcriptional regulator [Sporomusa ovata]|uniref:Transcriptional regulator, TetR family n=2 Tax=Sporomusa ovata TaxID=2378 RepID=A0A0U1KXV4_9FIRM|nr:TetR/AcrR family transcriptional regulator [Sporomusa ovata]CQR71959.1 Transcriptional regulator, TetR family [Sporomusa ovata]
MVDTKRQKQKQLTRKHVIEIAIKQFSETGITMTRTTDIAKAANVAHGTIFVHFPKQEDLLIAVIEEFGDRIVKRLQELIDSNRSLFEVLEAHIAGLAEFESFYTRLIIERRLLPATARDTYIMIQSAISIHIAETAEKEIKQGVIREFPIHLLFNTWLGLIHYYLTNGDLYCCSDSILKKHGHELLRHFIKLISIEQKYKEAEK